MKIGAIYVEPISDREYDEMSDGERAFYWALGAPAREKYAGRLSVLEHMRESQIAFAQREAEEKIKRAEQAKRRAERKARRDEWRAGVARIMAEARRREAFRPAIGMPRMIVGGPLDGARP